MELVRLYLNLPDQEARLREVVAAASSERPPEGSHPARQHQHRLSKGEVMELIAAYGQEGSVKVLAQRFAIHRNTIAALLHRHTTAQVRVITPRRPG